MVGEDRGGGRAGRATADDEDIATAAGCRIHGRGRLGVGDGCLLHLAGCPASLTAPAAPVTQPGGNRIKLRVASIGRRTTILGGMAVMAVACTAGPTTSAGFTAFATPDGDLAARAAEIRRAASGLGWTVDEPAPGHMTLRKRDPAEGSTIAIDFTEQEFRILPPSEDAAELSRSIVAQSTI